MCAPRAEPSAYLHSPLLCAGAAAQEAARFVCTSGPAFIRFYEGCGWVCVCFFLGAPALCFYFACSCWNWMSKLLTFLLGSAAGWLVSLLFTFYLWMCFFVGRSLKCEGSLSVCCCRRLSGLVPLSNGCDLSKHSGCVYDLFFYNTSIFSL